MKLLIICILATLALMIPIFPFHKLRRKQKLIPIICSHCNRQRRVIVEGTRYWIGTGKEIFCPDCYDKQAEEQDRKQIEYVVRQCIWNVVGSFEKADDLVKAISAALIHSEVKK